MACPFDQSAVLLANMDYMLTSLDLDRISIRHTDEEGVEPSILEAVCPGAPLVQFPPNRVRHGVQVIYRGGGGGCLGRLSITVSLLQEGVTLHFRNVDVSNGLFNTELVILDGDSVNGVLRRLRRTNRGIKRQLIRFSCGSCDGGLMLMC